MDQENTKDSTNLTALERRIQAQFVRQEHRLFAILRNAWTYKDSGDNLFRDAAFEALFRRIAWSLLPGAAVGTTGLIAVVGLMLALQGNVLFGEQNELLKEQTDLIAKQNELLALQIEEAQNTREITYRPHLLIQQSETNPYFLDPQEDFAVLDFPRLKEDLRQSFQMINMGDGAATELSWHWVFDPDDLREAATELDESLDHESIFVEKEESRSGHLTRLNNSLESRSHTFGLPIGYKNFLLLSISRIAKLYKDKSAEWLWPAPQISVTVNYSDVGGKPYEDTFHITPYVIFEPASLNADAAHISAQLRFHVLRVPE